MSNSREKGKRGERRCVHWVQPIYPDAHRSADQARDNRHCDVEGTPYWIEVKEGLQPNLFAALEQALRDRGAVGDSRPIMVFAHRTKAEGRPAHTVVLMLANEFMAELLMR